MGFCSKCGKRILNDSPVCDDCRLAEQNGAQQNQYYNPNPNYYTENQSNMQNGQQYPPDMNSAPQNQQYSQGGQYYQAEQYGQYGAPNGNVYNGQSYGFGAEQNAYSSAYSPANQPKVPIELGSSTLGLSKAIFGMISAIICLVVAGWYISFPTFGNVYATASTYLAVAFSFGIDGLVAGIKSINVYKSTKNYRLRPVATLVCGIVSLVLGSIATLISGYKLTTWIYLLMVLL